MLSASSGFCPTYLSSFVVQFCKLYLDFYKNSRSTPWKFLRFMSYRHYSSPIRYFSINAEAINSFVKNLLLHWFTKYLPIESDYKPLLLICFSNAACNICFGPFRLIANSYSTYKQQMSAGSSYQVSIWVGKGLIIIETSYFLVRKRNQVIGKSFIVYSKVAGCEIIDYIFCQRCDWNLQQGQKNHPLSREAWLSACETTFALCHSKHYKQELGWNIEPWGLSSTCLLNVLFLHDTSSCACKKKVILCILSKFSVGFRT